jgi:hypothetical protein
LTTLQLFASWLRHLALCACWTTWSWTDLCLRVICCERDMQASLASRQGQATIGALPCLRGSIYHKRMYSSSLADGLDYVIRPK